MSESGTEEVPGLKLLLQHEEWVLQSKKGLKLIFEEEIPDYRELPEEYVNILEIVAGPLLRVNDDREEALSVANALFNFIASSDSNFHVAVPDEVSDEFVDFLSEMRLKHDRTAGEAWLRAYQGENYWTAFQSDIVIRRPSNELGINHRIQLAEDGPVTITTDLRSNLDLARRILDAELSALRDFDDQQLLKISEEDLEKIVSTVNEIYNKHQEVHGEN